MNRTIRDTLHDHPGYISSWAQIERILLNTDRSGKYSHQELQIWPDHTICCQHKFFLRLTVMQIIIPSRTKC